MTYENFKCVKNKSLQKRAFLVIMLALTNQWFQSLNPLVYVYAAQLLTKKTDAAIQFNEET